MAVSQASVHFPCPPEQVWHTMTDLANSAWRSDLSMVEVLDETHFVEHSKSGYVTRFTVTACEPCRIWAFRMENGNMTGSWQGVFEVEENGTCLACTETIRAKHWWMLPFLPGYLKRQQKLYLGDLRRELLK